MAGDSEVKAAWFDLGRRAIKAIVWAFCGFGLGLLAAETNLLGYGSWRECVMDKVIDAGDRAELLGPLIAEECREITAR